MGIFTYRMNHGTKIWVPILMWYIDGAEQRILVDTGANAKFAISFRNLNAKNIMSFEEALDSIGLKPEDIDLVIQTHLHWDHCVNTSKCTNAKVLVQEDEVNFAYSPHPIMANLYYEPLFSDLDLMTVNGRYEVQPGIEVFPAPGHTPGIQAVSVNTEQGNSIISGFCSVKENFAPSQEGKDRLPVVATGTHTDLFASYDSALMIKESADILIPQHDPSFLTKKQIP
jgi:glyoxylase-like metal-dependent hydrolase (beta-lactamase superfamily II)